MCSLGSCTRVRVEARTNVSPMVLFRLRPKIIFASLIARVPLERSRYFKLLVMISLMGGLFGLCLVMQ